MNNLLLFKGYNHHHSQGNVEINNGISSTRLLFLFSLHVSNIFFFYRCYILRFFSCLLIFVCIHIRLYIRFSFFLFGMWRKKIVFAYKKPTHFRLSPCFLILLEHPFIIIIVVVVVAFMIQENKSKISLNISIVVYFY